MSDRNKKRSTKTEDALFKIIMVGKSAVGKSSLLTRYTKNIFQNDYQVTVGVQFASKLVKIDDTFNVKLTIWDTAGQESFKSIIKSYYRNSSAVFLVYDITNKDSFQSLTGWISEARENAPQNVMIILIGTHLDDAQNRQVHQEEVQKWRKQNNIQVFFQTSSKTDENVSQAFEQVAKQLFFLRMNKTKNTISNNQMQSISLHEDPDLKNKNNSCPCKN